MKNDLKKVIYLNIIILEVAVRVFILNAALKFVQ